MCVCSPFFLSSSPLSCRYICLPVFSSCLVLSSCPVYDDEDTLMPVMMR